MVCFMSFCAGTVSGKVWHSQRLNFICMCCSTWAGVVIQHEMSQSSVMQKLWSGLVPGVIRSVIHFISSHAQIVSNSFFSRDCTRHFSNQCGMYKVAKVVPRNRSCNHCNWSDTWLSMLLPHTTHHTHSLWFMGWGAGVRQNNSQFVWPVDDFFPDICWSELVRYYKLPLNTNHVSVSSV